ncbi:hypothetical protein F6Y05_36120 [Bacillus megaterium]|nr:hypothetical protein [Priestia megaterium]
MRAQLIGKPLHTFTSVSREIDNEIGIQNLISSSGSGIMSSLPDIKKITNEDLKILMAEVQKEYKQRVEAYANKREN